MPFMIAILCLLGVFLVGLEAIVPGGILGIAGWLAIGVSAWFCFSQYGTIVGTVYLVATTLGAALVWYLAFRFLLPKMALTPFEPQEGGREEAQRDARIGREAEVLEDLDPTGFVRLDGRRAAARAESSHEEIGPGQTVRIVDIDSTYLVCRRLDENDG